MQSRSSADETRSSILETAKTLLRRFGVDKLTIVDIARNLGMSHANIYRYFGNKTEILDAIIEEWLEEIEDLLRELSLQSGSATERLETLVVELHNLKRRKLREDEQVYESFRRVIQQRPQVVAQYRKLRLGTIVQLIREGIEAGEFDRLTEEEAEAAGAIFEDAMTLFLNPAMLALTAQQAHMELRARKVIRCMLAGFGAPTDLEAAPFSASVA